MATLIIEKFDVIYGKRSSQTADNFKANMETWVDTIQDLHDVEEKHICETLTFYTRCSEVEWPPTTGMFRKQLIEYVVRDREIKAAKERADIERHHQKCLEHDAKSAHERNMKARDKAMKEIEEALGIKIKPPQKSQDGRSGKSNTNARGIGDLVSKVFYAGLDNN